MKPNVYSQLYIHIIFAVKYRERLLTQGIRKEVFSYISGIITNRKSKSIILNGTLDHLHILVGLNPNEKISDLVGTIKKSSSTFINEKNWFPGKFSWQDAYGAFSYSKSQLDAIYKYIEKQEIHHKRRTFREEYTALLNKFEIEYDEKYLFEIFE